MSKEAMKLALEAIEMLVRFESDSWELGSCRIAGQATKALREALAEQPAQPQEPVAWMFQHEETGRTMCVDAQQVEWGFEKGNPRLKKIAPLYTSPPAQRTWVNATAWRGLTDEEIKALASWWPSYDQMPALMVLAKDIQNSLKEKNT